jgi:tetratricopeptide (TPR) repeat protein
MTLGDVGLTVTAQYYLGIVSYSLGGYRRAVDYAQKNIACLHGVLLQEHFGLPGRASVLSRGLLVYALAECGAFAEARAPAEEGVRMAEAADHPYSRFLAYWALSFRALCQGDLRQAIPALERTFTFAQGAHIRLGVHVATAALGAAYALAGRTADALPRLEQAVEQALAMRFFFDHALRVVWLGEAYLLAGRLEEAESQAQRALEFARTHQERGHEASALQLLGEVAAQRTPPDRAAAATYYHQALALADALGMRPLQAHCHRGLGTLYVQTGQRELARSALTTAIAMYREMEMTFWLPETEAALAQMEA